MANVAVNRRLYLSQVLGESEERALSADVADRLEAHLRGKEALLEAARGQLNAAAVERTKDKASVEREFVNLKMKLQMSEEFVDRLRSQLRDAEDNLQKARRTYYDVIIEKDNINSELETQKRRAERMAAEKVDLSCLLDRRVTEVETLEEEIKGLNSRLQLITENKLETSLRAEEIEFRQLSLSHREARMEQESSLQLNQINSLNAEVSRLTNELASVRRERVNASIQLESELEHKSSEASRLQEEVVHLKRLVDKKDKHLTALAERIREMQETTIQMEQHFENENKAQNNLIQLHKKSTADEKERNLHLLKTIEDMQHLLKTAEKAHNDLEETFNQKMSTFHRKMKEKSELMALLEAELNEAKAAASKRSQQNRDQELEQYFPAASTANKLLRTSSSISHIYGEYVRYQEELAFERNENNKLREQIEQMVCEAEENAPMLHSKVQEYQKAAQTVNELQGQVSKLANEREQWVEERDNLIQLHNQLQRQCKRYEQENYDLGRQVRCLIKSVQEARGVSFYATSEEVTSSDEVGQESSVNRVISAHLVTFKDIEELQINNQRLICAIRELGEKQEELENQVKEKESDGHESVVLQLNTALAELETMRSERRQQTETLEALVQQRDAYLNPNFGDPFSPQRNPFNVSNASPRTAFVEERVVTGLKQSLEQITAEFAEYRKEREKKVDNLTQQLAAQKEEILNDKVEKSKLASQIEYNEERLNSAEEIMTQMKSESESLKEKNIKLSENFKKLNAELKVMKEELCNTRESLRRSEGIIETLRAERDMLRNNEMKLTHEREGLLREQQLNATVIETLKSFRGDMEKLKLENTGSLKSLAEKLEKECIYLKSRLERETSEHQEAKAASEKKIFELQKQLVIESDKTVKVREELRKTCEKLDSTEKELMAYRKGETASFSQKLTEAQSKTDDLIQQLNKQKKEAQQLMGERDQLKLQVADREDKLKKLSLQAKADKNKAFSETQAKVSDLEQSLEKVTQENQQVISERADLKNQVAEKDERIKKIALQARQRIQSLTSQKNALTSQNEEQAKKLSETEQKVASLEQTIEEGSLRLRTLQSQFEGRVTKLEAELTEAQESVNRLQLQLQAKASQQAQAAVQPAQTQPQTPLVPSLSTTTSTAAPSAAVCSTAPVRHQVHPQQLTTSSSSSLVSKATPTASIRPLPVSNPLSRVNVSSRSTASTQTRGATVVTVQPTTEDSASMSLHSSQGTVPQATVTPTPSVIPTIGVVVATSPLLADQVPSTSSAPVTLISQPDVPVTELISREPDETSKRPEPSQEVNEAIEPPQVAEKPFEAMEEPAVSAPIEETEEVATPSQPIVVPTVVPVGEPQEGQLCLKRGRSSPTETKEEDSVSQSKRLRATEAETADSEEEQQSEEGQSHEMAGESSAIDEDKIGKFSRTQETCERHDEAGREETNQEEEEEEEEEIEADEDEEEDEEVESQVEPRLKLRQHHTNSSDDVIILESDDDSKDEEAVEEEEEGEEDNSDDSDEESLDDEEEEEEEEEDDEEEEEEEEEEAIEERFEGEREEVEEEMQQEGEEQESYNEEEVAEEAFAEDHGVGQSDESRGEAEEGEGEGEEVEIIGIEEGNDSHTESQDDSNLMARVPQEQESSVSNSESQPGASGVEGAVSRLTEPMPGRSSLPASGPGAQFMQAPAPVQRSFQLTPRGPRLSALGRQSLYLGPTGHQTHQTFDDGDDSIVPSTPTLFVPRRGDGFAEALNSPRVPQSRFEFVPPESGQGLGQLASQGALGVDDTRMDLSQFNDNNNSNGRIVPVLPTPSVSLPETGHRVSITSQPSTSSTVSESEVASQAFLMQEMNAPPSEEPSQEQACDIDAMPVDNIPAPALEPVEMITAHLVESDDEGDDSKKEESRPVGLIQAKGKLGTASVSATTSETITTSDQTPSTSASIPMRTRERKTLSTRGRTSETGTSSGPRPLQRRPIVWKNPDLEKPVTSSEPPALTPAPVASQAPVPVPAPVQPIDQQQPHPQQVPQETAIRGDRGGRRLRLRGARFASGTARRASGTFRGRPGRSRGGFNF